MASLHKITIPQIVIILYGAFGIAPASFSDATLDNNSDITNHARSVMPGEALSSKSRTIQIVESSHDDASIAKRVALVVGNGNYEKILKLNNPRNDASDVCAELSALKFDVVCMHDIRTRREFRDVVRIFMNKLGPRTVAVFYYAGHGIQLNGENYLLPTAVDARSSADIEDDGLNLSYLLRSLEEARSSPNIVILDACRNSPFPQLKFGNANKGLARIEPPIGTMLVYATAPNGVALDGDGRNGIFTKHFIKYIREPGLKIDELFQVVSNNVQAEARTFNVEQVPFRSSSYSGAYCIAGCENPLVAAEIEQIKLQREEAVKELKKLSEENINLKRQASEKSLIIDELEGKIAALPRTAPSGAQSSALRAEMARLKVALSIARAEQADLDRLRKSVSEREEKISGLQQEIASLQSKVDELEAYRRQILELQRQSDMTADKMHVLAEENARLKRLADSRNENVGMLEARINKLSIEANQSGEQRSSTHAELAKLRTALESARAQQKDLETLKGIMTERENEILELRNQMAELHNKSKQLETSRQQIMALQKENAENALLIKRQQGVKQKDKQILLPPTF